jgi:hypothetical protein
MRPRSRSKARARVALKRLLADLRQACPSQIIVGGATEVVLLFRSQDEALLAALLVELDRSEPLAITALTPSPEREWHAACYCLDVKVDLGPKKPIRESPHRSLSHWKSS